MIVDNHLSVRSAARRPGPASRFEEPLGESGPGGRLRRQVELGGVCTGHGDEHLCHFSAEPCARLVQLALVGRRSQAR